MQFFKAGPVRMEEKPDGFGVRVLQAAQDFAGGKERKSATRSRLAVDVEGTKMLLSISNARDKNYRDRTISESAGEGRRKWIGAGVPE